MYFYWKEEENDMLTEEVRNLTERFVANMENITSMHRLVTVVEKKYRDFWSEIWKECEASHHDEFVNKDDSRNSGGKSRFCPYCGKKLTQLLSFLEDSFPQKIYQINYLKRWLLVEPEEWPEEKRELLFKIKEGIGEYLIFAEPLQEKMRILAGEQLGNRAQIDEIRSMCDDALHHVTKS